MRGRGAIARHLRIRRAPHAMPPRGRGVLAAAINPPRERLVGARVYVPPPRTSSDGMEPDRSLAATLSCCSEVPMEPSCDGICAFDVKKRNGTPASRVEWEGSANRVEGAVGAGRRGDKRTVPLRLLLSSLSTRTAVSLPSSVGSVPLSIFALASSTSRVDRAPSCVGSGPATALARSESAVAACERGGRGRIMQAPRESSRTRSENEK